MTPRGGSVRFRSVEADGAETNEETTTMNTTCATTHTARSAAVTARAAVRISPRFKLDWSWPAPSCVGRAVVRGVPRRGVLVPAKLCLDERRSAPLGSVSSARGVNVSFATDHVNNILCAA